MYTTGEINVHREATNQTQSSFEQMDDSQCYAPFSLSLEKINECEDSLKSEGWVPRPTKQQYYTGEVTAEFLTPNADSDGDCPEGCDDFEEFTYKDKQCIMDLLCPSKHPYSGCVRYVIGSSSRYGNANLTAPVMELFVSIAFGDARIDRACTSDLLQFNETIFVYPRLLGGVKVQLLTKKVRKNRQLVTLRQKPRRQKLQVAVTNISRISKPVRRMKLTNSTGFNAMSEDARWALALREPFNPNACGARIPDNFSFPTIPYRLRGNVVMNAATGSWTLAFSPDPILTFIDIAAFNGNAASLSSSSLASYAVNTFLYGASTPNSMASAFSSIRVVAAGMRYRNAGSITALAGRLTFAPVVNIDHGCGYNTLNTATVLKTSSVGQRLTYGTTAALLDSGSIAELPGSEQAEVPILIRQDLELRCKPVSADFLKFRATYANGDINSTQSVSDNGILMTTGATSVSATGQGGAPDMDQLGLGWSSCVAHFTNCTGSVVDAEFIIHIEVQPSLLTGTGVFLTSETLAPKSGHTVDTLLAHAHNVPWAQYITGGVNYISEMAKSDTGRKVMAVGARAIANRYGLGLNNRIANF